MAAETSYERFERLAEEFYRETRMMAPGKDSPAALGGPDYTERTARWCEWLAARPAEPAPGGEASEPTLDAAELEIAVKWLRGLVDRRTSGLTLANRL